jgi:hypothetical protein
LELICRGRVRSGAHQLARWTADEKPPNRLGLLFGQVVEDFDFARGEEFDAEQETLLVVVGEGNALLDFARLLHTPLAYAQVSRDRPSGGVVERTIDLAV